MMDARIWAFANASGGELPRSQNRVGERLNKLSYQSTIYQMLLALDYLHTECKIIHRNMTRY